MLSIMSRRYPFFRSPDDLTALAELMCLFGCKTMNKMALKHLRKSIFVQVKLFQSSDDWMSLLDYVDRSATISIQNYGVNMSLREVIERFGFFLNRHGLARVEVC